VSESAEQMHKRLCGVIADARFEVLPQAYAWEQLSEPSRLPADALAVVRDGSVWYALTSVPPNATGAYRILVFHFAEGSNASGFVAWLAGMMKEGGRNWRHGGVRLRRPSDTRAVANLTRPVRLLGMSMGPGR